MAQIVRGIRSVLSSSILYSAFQTLMGAHAVRLALVNDAIKPETGMSILDIGCGPAEILEYLPDVKYWGFDISEPYIKQAESKYGERGIFHCKLLTNSDVDELPAFDIVLAIGLLHHLDDDIARSLLNLAHKALKPGGRLITLDPCFQKGQNSLARFLISRDRGQNVRTKTEYLELTCDLFSDSNAEVRHKTGVPYTHCIMVCKK